MRSVHTQIKEGVRLRAFAPLAVQFRPSPVDKTEFLINAISFQIAFHRPAHHWYQTFVEVEKPSGSLPFTHSIQCSPCVVYF